MRTPSIFLILAAVAATLSGAFAANLQLARRPRSYSFVGFFAGFIVALAALAVAAAQ